jgi:YesN/AraC family two-component response regulator
VQWGTKVDLAELKAAYFRTRVIARHQYDSVVRLLGVFAQHLSALSNQVMTQEATAENPVITRARTYIAEHQGENLSLRTVAAAMHVSAFHFCKIFKRSTSLTFTDYLARIRVETVKQQMLNPHLRVSEIAYATGFQSLSQFNRVFHRIVGEAPTKFRERQHAGLGGRPCARAA